MGHMGHTTVKAVEGRSLPCPRHRGEMYLNGRKLLYRFENLHYNHRVDNTMAWQQARGIGRLVI